MRVSQLTELDTHAVIGGGKAQAFGIAETAEFFTVLSDTLYRDKKRAVVREVICNAWDAHIMVGKTDTPVEVTLTEEELVIKDFGPGIAHDKIGPIYCVYGASTKVADEHQTGGFGLGCKAPFAYSHHFSVTSCHDGHRTVYAISRGSSETEGRPDYRAMVRVPSTETGITVSIPIKDRADKFEFERIIRTVAWQGGMLVKLNGELLPFLDYSEARKTGYMIVQYNSDMPESDTYVLYGTVLYPISTTDKGLMDRNRALHEFVEPNSRVILVAPPNTIGITPSRESLSYSDLTTATLYRLMDRMQAQIKRHVPAAIKEAVRARLETMGRYNLSTSFTQEQVSWDETSYHDPKVIAQRAVTTKIDHFLTYHRRWSLLRKEAMRKWKDDRRAIRRMQEPGWGYISSRDILHSARLFVRLASKVGLLGQLCFITHHYGGLERGRCFKVVAQELRGAAEPILAIGSSQRAIMDFYRGYAKTFSRAPTYRSLMGIVVSKGQESKIAEIKRLAEQYKIKVMECAKPEPRQRSQVPTSVFHDFYTWKFKNRKILNEPTLSSAPFYIRASGALEYLKLPAGVTGIADQLKELYPQVAVALNAPQEAKLKKLGAKNLLNVLLDEVKALSNSREVQYAYLATSGIMIRGHYYWDTVAHKAQILAKADIRLAKTLFPARVSFGEKTDRAEKLIKVLNHLRSKDSNIAAKTDEVVGDLRKKAQERFKDVIIDVDEANKRFRYLAAIETRCDDKDLLLEMVRFAQRQCSKSVVTDTTQRDAMKEAA